MTSAYRTATFRVVSLRQWGLDVKFRWSRCIFAFMNPSFLSDAKFFPPFVLFGDEFPTTCPFSTRGSVTHCKEKCRWAEASVLSEWYPPISAWETISPFTIETVSTQCAKWRWASEQTNPAKNCETFQFRVRILDCLGTCYWWISKLGENVNKTKRTRVTRTTWAGQLHMIAWWQRLILQQIN